VTKTRTVLLLSTALALFALGSVVALERQADGSRKAQLKLAAVKTAVLDLQNAAWTSSPSAGGSPARARAQMQADERDVSATLEALRHMTPPAPLHGIPGALRANLAVLHRIYALGLAPAGYNSPLSDPLGAAQGKTLGPVLGMIAASSATYDHRADSARMRATIGSAVAILSLLVAFGVFFVRSARARAKAERLVGENAALLETTREHAVTDQLTGLRNRRGLMADIEDALTSVTPERQLVFAIFDLDGFKQYNDTFGHPAGDALLTRLGERLLTALGDRGVAYRMGGDEFCLLARDSDGGAATVALAAGALSEAGDAFTIGCSYGSVLVPSEARTGEEALRLADQRMYEQKTTSRSSAVKQSSDVLLKVLSERSADLEEHLSGVARLAQMTAAALGLSEYEAKRTRLAASLHDVGKTAIPDAILEKPGPLDEEEWAFIRRHTVIGERIIRAAPSLAHAAELVRASHERVDGGGYPDGLRGEEIPLGARVIAVCDAFDAMLAQRPYRASMTVEDALAELRRCAGTQFDETVVDAFCRLMEGEHRKRAAA
jgi:diguanylate cyclase (GGDEF)-like protein